MKKGHETATGKEIDDLVANAIKDIKRRIEDCESAAGKCAMASIKANSLEDKTREEKAAREYNAKAEGLTIALDIINKGPYNLRNIYSLLTNLTVASDTKEKANA